MSKYINAIINDVTKWNIDVFFSDDGLTTDIYYKKKKRCLK